MFFKCICGLYYLDEGQIWIQGKQMKKDIDMLTEAGIIIEEPAFLRSYTGYQNLNFLYRLRHPPKSGKRVCNYSLGMRQRLAIVQAIMEKLF